MPIKTHLGKVLFLSSLQSALSTQSQESLVTAEARAGYIHGSQVSSVFQLEHFILLWSVTMNHTSAAVAVVKSFIYHIYHTLIYLKSCSAFYSPPPVTTDIWRNPHGRYCHHRRWYRRWYEDDLWFGSSSWHLVVGTGGGEGEISASSEKERQALPCQKPSASHHSRTNTRIRQFVVIFSK